MCETSQGHTGDAHLPHSNQSVVAMPCGREGKDTFQAKTVYALDISLFGKILLCPSNCRQKDGGVTTESESFAQSFIVVLRT